MRLTCEARGKAFASLAIVQILGASLYCRPQQRSSPEMWPQQGRFSVRVIARGSKVFSSTGNMDVYLVLLSLGKRGLPAAARVVDYYPGYQAGISDEQILSGHALRLRLRYADYCRMRTADFAVRRVFDPEALEKVRETGGLDTLPCFVVWH